MAVYAIVPVKVLGSSKRRLSQILEPQQRKLLTMAMLEDVLGATFSSEVQKTVVVSDDTLVRSMAVQHGAVYLKEKKRGLNLAIESAVEWCVKDGADSVVVLPADIPLLSSVDVNSILELGRAQQTVVILSPSHNGGTNALLLKPPSVINACFGAKSFRKHVSEVLTNHVMLKLYYSNSVAMDMDEKADIGKLFQTPNSTHCRKYLEQIGVRI